LLQKEEVAVVISSGLNKEWSYALRGLGIVLITFGDRKYYSELSDIVIDYTQQAFEKVLQDIDVVFETLGGENQQKSFQVVKPGGILVSIVGIPSAAWARAEGLPFFMPWLFNLMNRKNHGLAKKHKVRFETVMLKPDGKNLAIIAGMVTEGKLKPIVDQVFPLAQTREALLYSQSGRAKGKIVIQVKP
jgi:alcohol dehydrogenase